MSNGLNILFITPYPIEGPSSRFRVWQYLPYFKKAGHKCTVSAFLNAKNYRNFYREGYLKSKLKILLVGFLKRLAILLFVSRYDIIVIQREAFPFGPPIIERLVKLLNKRIIFDFDDAIYHPQTSEGNRFFLFLKPITKTRRIITFSSLVIAGNATLAEYAMQYNSKTEIIPTPINIDYYRPKVRNNEDPVVIGWSGSRTTAPFLLAVEKALRSLKHRFGQEIRIIIIGGDTFRFRDLQAEYKEWSLDTELHDLQSFDIGIMPLPDNEWTRGKCGFKALQYMSVGIPAVCSAVGVNREIINHGENGFLIENEKKWESILSSLIQDPKLRIRIGNTARQYVKKHYSLEHWAAQLLKIMKNL